MSDGLVARQRNYTMDIVKCIAAIGVVPVHFQFPCVIGRILCSVGVCGVVVFFMISGYYAYDPDDEKAAANILKRFKRNLIITLIALGVYLIFTVIEQISLGIFDFWLEKLKDPWLYVRAVFMGDFEFIAGDPLWFMAALIFSYLIFFVLHKLKITKYAYVLLPLLLLLRIGMETYTNTFGADWHMSGNFLVGAMPVMLLGHYIAYRKENFLKIPLYMTVSFAVISAALMFLTVNITVFELDVSQIFKIWCGAEIFILAICLPGSNEVPLISDIGAKYSLYIYLSHYLIGMAIKDVMFSIDAPLWVIDYVLPPVVIVVSVLLSAGIYALVKAIKTKNKAEPSKA